MLGDVELLLRSAAVLFPGSRSETVGSTFISRSDCTRALPALAIFPESRSETVGSTFISTSDCTRALPTLAIFRKTCTEVRKNLEPITIKRMGRLHALYDFRLMLANGSTDSGVLVKGHTLVARLVPQLYTSDVFELNDFMCEQ